MAEVSPPDVYISFAPVRADEELLALLVKHLKASESDLAVWHRGQTIGGDDEEGEARSRLASAPLILLLVSADYLASEECRAEIDVALERDEAGDARVIPILLRPCAWEKASIRRFAPLPRGGTAITSTPYPHDEAWAAVAREIRENAVRSELRRRRPVAGSGEGKRGRGFPPNNLPPRREHFVGREAELRELDELLARERYASIVQGRRASIYGLGGIGKTTLAIEHAYRTAERYQGGIWWVNAEGSPATGVVSLAETLRSFGPSSLRIMMQDLPEAHDKLAQRVRLALQNQQEAMLLILDNVTDAAWRELLPAGQVHVLLTTRDERLVVGQPSYLGVLPDEDAVDLVERLGGKPRSSTEEEALRRVVIGELGGLAVAVEMAARAVGRWARTWDTYERHLRERARTLLDRSELRTDYPRSVFAALALSIELCEPGSPARWLLEVCAFLAPAHLPVDQIAPVVNVEAIDFQESVARLRGLGLVVLDEESGALSMHRLVQSAVRVLLPPEERRKRVEQAVRIIDIIFPESSDDVETWPECGRLLPHAVSTTAHAEELGVAREERARLMARFAVYLQGRAAFLEAKEHLQRSLTLHEMEHGVNDPRIAAVLRSLGSVRHDLGELMDAKACFERALAIDEDVYGPDHPDVARDVNDLGSVLMDLGDLPRARGLLERALSIDEAAYGPDDPSVAIRLNNLGALFRDLGDFATARSYLERALIIDLRAYGPDHPTVAIGRTNLGRLLHDLGDRQGAMNQFEAALRIDEQTYGQDHPRFALALNNRGRVLRDLGDRAGARADFERALAIVTRIYGPDHPDVARDLNNLGSVLRDLGDLDGARELFERVLRIAEATYGPEHPAVAIVCNNLGSVLQVLGNLEGARVVLERALWIAETTYGAEHPVVASISNNLGRVHQALGNLPVAWQLITRAVAITTRALGPSHPSVQIFAHNLERVGDALGSLEDLPLDDAARLPQPKRMPDS